MESAFKITVDKARYTLPLDENGEVVITKEVGSDTLIYKKKVEKYLSKLKIDEEELELKRLFLFLPFVKNLVNFSSPEIVDRYSYSTESITAMKDIYGRTVKGNKVKENSAFHSYQDFNDSSLIEAQKARAIFNEAIRKYGNMDNNTYNDSHMSKNKYDVICYLRDRDIAPSWAAYFTDMGDQQNIILKIYDGFVYGAFLKEEDK